MNKIKVLYFVDRLLVGGIQSLMIEWVDNIDKEKIQIDFLVLDDGNSYELEKEFESKGCKIYKLDKCWLNGIKDIFRYRKELKDFFKKHNDYDVIHFNSSSKNFLVLMYAKKYGIKKRIAHSHNIDFQTQNLFKKFIGNVLKIFLKQYATHFVACSKDAGTWLFGKNIINNENYQVICNGINYEKFKFNKEKRENIRQDLNISNDEIIIGNVGRFSNQKNHEFLIRIFNEIQKNNDKYKLLLVGTGENESELRKMINSLGIEKKVIFVGFKSNVEDYFQAMDLFVFPSKFEGLGKVLIEAQANGLKCLASKDVVPKEAKITDNFKFISLENEKEWITEILENDISRKDTSNAILNAGYDIKDCVKKIEELYK